MGTWCRSILLSCRHQYARQKAVWRAGSCCRPSLWRHHGYPSPLRAACRIANLAGRCHRTDVAALLRAVADRNDPLKFNPLRLEIEVERDCRSGGYFHRPFLGPVTDKPRPNELSPRRHGGQDVSAIFSRYGSDAILGAYLNAGERGAGHHIGYAADVHRRGLKLVLCGDMNIARAEMDVHPKERKPRAIGQLPQERELFEKLLAQGLVDVGRTLYPEDENYFSWWAPWRNLRQRNIGWRLDYVLASKEIAKRAVSCPSQREVGTSDHAPVVATFE